MGAFGEHGAQCDDVVDVKLLRDPQALPAVLHPAVVGLGCDLRVEAVSVIQRHLEEGRLGPYDAGPTRDMAHHGACGLVVVVGLFCSEVDEQLILDQRTADVAVDAVFILDITGLVVIDRTVSTRVVRGARVGVHDVVGLGTQRIRCSSHRCAR